MTMRISKESLIRAHDSGYRSFKWMSRLAKKHLELATDVCLKELTGLKNAKERVQQVEPITIYRALMAEGASDSLEVLELLSSEQVTRILDYDAWSEGRLIPQRAFQWLALYADISKKALYERFKDLEEEYQLSLLSPFVRIFEPDEYEELSEEKQDQLHSFPGQAIYYEITTENHEIEKFIVDLLDATMTENMEYALSLVAHAAYLPPNESELAITQFRNARNEEDGFIPYDEAKSVFYEIDHVKLEEKWNALLPKSEDGLKVIDMTSNSEQFFLRTLSAGNEEVWSDEEKNNVSRSYLHLSNQLASVVGIEPGDLFELKKILEQTYCLTGFALESLSAGDPRVAAKILISEYPKTLFRYSVSVVGQLRKEVISLWTAQNTPEISKFRGFFETGKYGLCIDWLDNNILDTQGAYFTEVYKGLFNRFVLVPNEGVGEQGYELDRISFNPLDSVAAYEKLKLEVSASMLLDRLAYIANGERSGNRERILIRSIASVLIGGKFINAIFSESQIEKLLEVTSEDFTAKLSDLFTAITTNIVAGAEAEDLAVDSDRLMTRLNLHLSSLAMDLSRAIANGSRNSLLTFLSDF